MTRNEIREKLGLAPDIADASGSTQAMQGNDALVNITGRQQQALLRISRLFTNGKLTKQQAAIQLRAFGFTDEQINAYLGVDDNPLTNDFAAIEDDILLNEFAACGDDVNEFTIVEKKAMRSLKN